MLLGLCWKCGCGIGPTEKLRNTWPSAELGVCGGCHCCCQTRWSSPSIRACLSCFSFSSSMSSGQMAQTALQKAVHVSCELQMSAFSMGGSCCHHPTTKRLLLSGIAFASLSILFAHAMCEYTSVPFTFTFVACYKAPSMFSSWRVLVL